MHIKLLQKTSSGFALLFLVQLQFGITLFAQDCKAKVEILSSKANSLIYIDSVLVGNGKVDYELTKGSHSLTINEGSGKWGQAQIRDSLKIYDCQKKYTFTYELKKSYVFPTQELHFGNGYAKKNENFFSSYTFKILLGSAAVLGGVAAYFKIQADKKYDDYLKSKNQSLLDDIDRLDLYSGISFGLLQINFGYLIYKFLTD